MMLTHPTTGAKVRCEAHRAYALTVPNGTDPTKMVVLKRTNDPDVSYREGRRLARTRNQTVSVFTLRDGRFIGEYTP